MNKLIITFAVAALALGAFAQKRGGMQANPEAKLHRFSTTIEKERPQLNQETKDLIAAFRRNPTSGAPSGRLTLTDLLDDMERQSGVRTHFRFSSLARIDNPDA